MKTIKFYAGLALLTFSSISIAEEQTAGTNVIGSQEAPTVLNVVPWKDKEVKLEKKDPSSALLDRVLEPLDQEVLLREIEYFNVLHNQAEEEEGLFLQE